MNYIKSSHLKLSSKIGFVPSFFSPCTHFMSVSVSFLKKMRRKHTHRMNSFANINFVAMNRKLAQKTESPTRIASMDTEKIGMLLWVCVYHVLHSAFEQRKRLWKCIIIANEHFKYFSWNLYCNGMRDVVLNATVEVYDFVNEKKRQKYIQRVKQTERNERTNEEKKAVVSCAFSYILSYECVCKIVFERKKACLYELIHKVQLKNS